MTSATACRSLSFFLRRSGFNCDKLIVCSVFCFFFFQAEDGIRDLIVTGVQTCALPICTTGRASGRALDRTGGETDPRILRIESAGAENAALAAVHLDLNEAVAVEVAAQRRNDVVHVRSHHVTQLTMGAGMARNGVDRTLRRAGGEGQHLE